MTKTHDPRCRELAHIFLNDISFPSMMDREDAAADLANDIQTTIEDWIMMEELRRENLPSAEDVKGILAQSK